MLNAPFSSHDPGTRSRAQINRKLLVGLIILIIAVCLWFAKGAHLYYWYRTLSKPERRLQLASLSLQSQQGVAEPESPSSTSFFSANIPGCDQPIRLATESDIIDFCIGEDEIYVHPCSDLDVKEIKPWSGGVPQSGYRNQLALFGQSAKPFSFWMSNSEFKWHTAFQLVQAFGPSCTEVLLFDTGRIKGWIYYRDDGPHQVIDIFSADETKCAEIFLNGKGPRFMDLGLVIQVIESASFGADTLGDEFREPGRAPTN